MNDIERAYHYFFSAIETGEQIDVKGKEGHKIYLEAEKALNKQIPKKATKNRENEYICPECNSVFPDMFGEFECVSEQYKFDYCPDCGQRLDWSVEQ